MAQNNGVIRVGRKGRKKFAFGDEGQPGSEPFEVDVVVAFQEWIRIDGGFRDLSDDRTIRDEDMADYHRAAVDFATRQRGGSNSETGAQPEPITTAEALDFIARLRECYDEVADFFLPRSRGRSDSPATTETELRFSEEGS